VFQRCEDTCDENNYKCVSESQINIGINKPTKSSNFASGLHTSAACVDANDHTHCHSEWGSKHWIQIDLQKSYQIVIIQIVARVNWQSRINGFGIYIGNNVSNAHANDLFVVIQQTTLKKIYTNYDKAFIGRYVYVSTIQPSAGLLNFAEIIVFK